MSCSIIYWHSWHKMLVFNFFLCFSNIRCIFSIISSNTLYSDCNNKYFRLSYCHVLNHFVLTIILRKSNSEWLSIKEFHFHLKEVVDCLVENERHVNTTLDAYTQRTRFGNLVASLRRYWRQKFAWKLCSS